MALVIKRKTGVSGKPKAVIFDTDNTLYSYDGPHKVATVAVEVKACRILGVTLDQFRGALKTARGSVKNRLGNSASSHSRLLYYQRAIELLGMRTQILLTLDLEQTYWRTFLSSCKVFPGVKELVNDLRNMGISTAIITDLTSQIQFRKLIYFGIDNLFDYVVTSEEAGIDKPDSAPFDIALEKLDVGAEEVWMVGDNHCNDIMGAKKMGIIAVQKRHHGVYISDDPGCEPDIVFDDFSDLRVFVDGLGCT